MIKRVVLAAVLIVVVLIFLTQSGQGAFLSNWWKDITGSGPVGQVASAIPKPALPTALPTIPALPSTESKQVSAPPTLLPADLPTAAATVVADLGRIPETTTDQKPYDANAFGPALTVRPAGGCDTADRVLAAQLHGPTFADAPANCVVASGLLVDPYTGTQRTVTGTPLAGVTIDPVVSSKWAWENGAAAWTPALRQQLADDPGNLRAVADSTARDRSGASPAEWSPADGTRRCELVSRFVEIVAHYRLTMPAGEKATLNRDLADCP